MILKRLRYLLPIAACCVSLSVFSQQHFPREIPAGNYSGICALGEGRYAVVDDKAKEDGFYVFQLDVDTVRQRITGAKNLGYHSSGKPNRDMEGICFHPSSQTLFISGEADNEVYEYNLDGKRTGRRLNVPAEFKRARRNKGLEALAYDTLSHQFFITTELPLPGEEMLRIQSFGDDLQPLRQYQYKPDAPISRKFYHGVSALCAMGDGRLLVLERQVRVPRLKLDAQTVIRIYEVRPSADTDTLLEKHLIKEFRTRLTLTGRKFANYEGMYALSPNKLLLVADSQNRYKKVLRDWFLVLGI